MWPGILTTSCSYPILIARKNNKRKRQQAVSNAPVLFKAVPMRPILKELLFSETWTAGANGGFAQAEPIATVLSNTNDFNTMSGVFQRIHVLEVEIMIYPDYYYTTSNNTAYYGSAVIGYSPTDSAAPASNDAALQQQYVNVFHTTKPMRMAFKPLTSTGVNGPVPYSIFGATAGFLGYLRSFAGAGDFSNNASIAFVVWRFKTHWFYGE
jgi:hypothetical protein